jgi:uncharacterized protein
MKIVNYASYVEDPDLVTRVRPIHREYMDVLVSEGRLVAGGPFEDGKGALFVYEVGSPEEVRGIVAVDPYTREGVFADSQLRQWTVARAVPDLLSADAGGAR